MAHGVMRNFNLFYYLLSSITTAKNGQASTNIWVENVFWNYFSYFRQLPSLRFPIAHINISSFSSCTSSTLATPRPTSTGASSPPSTTCPTSTTSGWRNDFVKKKLQGGQVRKMKVPPCLNNSTANLIFCPNKKVKKNYCIFGRFRVGLLLKNDDPFSKKNCMIFLKKKNFLLHESLKFSETAPTSQILWAVGQINFTGHLATLLKSDVI